MRNYIDSPNYYGLWIKKEEDVFEREFDKFAPFLFWKTGENSGKIFEYYQNELVISLATNLIDDEKGRFSLEKKYIKKIGDLTEKTIFFEGGNNFGFIVGEWYFEGENGKNISGDFYMGGCDDYKKVERKLGELYFDKLRYQLIKMIDRDKEEFPFSPKPFP